MNQEILGQFAALLTAVFWTGTALVFENASKRIGSLATNVIRLFLALVWLSFFSLIYRGQFLPLDATVHQVIWLGISGLIGFVLGDFFLFKAFQVIGARITMLIQALVPPISAFTAWIILGETMTVQSFLGMSVTLLGISLVILQRKDKSGLNIKFEIGYSAKGLFFAFLGAVGQGVGLVLSKYAMEDYDAFAASQIRVFVGFLAYAAVTTAFLRWPHIIKSLKNKSAIISASAGSVLGPFLGVSFSLIAVQNANTGVASTIMSTTPVLIIIPTIIIFKQKVSWREIIGAAIAVVGVALFFIHF